MPPFTHFDDLGRARMVDVSEKSETARTATATATIRMRPETLAMVREGRHAKGDVLAVAQVAAIMGAKRTSDLIPMCHPLGLEGIKVDFELGDDAITVKVTARLTGKTGVEMEALTGASIAALTVYDMCKAADKDLVVTDVMLLRKKGGKSGDYHRAESPSRPSGPASS